MPSLSDYIANFGITDWVVLAIIVAVIVGCREGKRIFRRIRR